MKFLLSYKFFTLLIVAGLSLPALGQGGLIRGVSDRVGGLRGNSGGNNGNSGGKGGDSSNVAHRDYHEDSVSLRYYRLDTSRAQKLDSSISDFTKRFPIPATHLHLGNTGQPTKSYLFDPQAKAGWDAGFHGLDVYRWTPEKVRFYNTTKPYTELSYFIASRAEQNIEILHTQNIRPYLNISLGYRLINAPGTFRNQKTNHNNYLFSSWYESPKKRYNNYFMLVANRLQNEENGGIVSRDTMNKAAAFISDRYNIPTNLGGSPVFSTNFFSSALATGHRYRDMTLVLRQQYDLGQKDSIVTDSTVIPLFYPRVRFEHTLQFAKYSYSFQDFPLTATLLNNIPDSGYYSRNYGVNIRNFKGDSVFYRDNWREISNDFSIYQFPDAKNLQQYIKLGAQLQLLSGKFDSSSVSLYNIIGHAEYRNRSRNQKWDINAFGRLYFTGYNAGDYHAYASLQRLLSKRLGTLQVGFENVSRSPSFIYDRRSSFYLDADKSFNKENTIHLFAKVWQPGLGLQLTGDYYLISNYLYLTSFYRLQQEGTLFNVLRIGASKKFRLNRHWNLYSDVWLQQKAGNADVNLPAFFTRNRIMYEGNLGFRFLDIAFGLEGRYHTPYKADDYSPVLGQSFYQNNTTISNKPDLAAFMHLRIRAFTLYTRFENLNTASFNDGFHFNNNNFAAPLYPTQGMIFRFGINWSFVN